MTEVDDDHDDQEEEEAAAAGVGRCASWHFWRASGLGDSGHHCVAFGARFEVKNRKDTGAGPFA